MDSHRKEDGSVVQPSPDGRKHIAKVLRKAGHTEDKVAAVLNRYDAGPDNQLLPFAPGRAAIRWRIDRLEPVAYGPSLSEQALLKIAYEFAVFHLAEKAYEESPQLDALRTAVLSPAQGAEAFSIEYLTTREYMPVHGLSLAGQSPHVTVTVCLFGWLVFRVHLRRIAIAPPYFKYTLLLDTGEELCEQIGEKGASAG